MHSRRRFLQSALMLAPATLMITRAALGAEALAFAQLYRRQEELSDKVKGLAGQPVEMVGYMAPPLKAEAKFFVLTSLPMSFCPFCETEAQWPSDIVLVLTQEAISAVPFNRPIRVRGTLDIGFQTDPDTGFVSLIRLRNSEYEKI